MLSSVFYYQWLFPNDTLGGFRVSICFMRNYIWSKGLHLPVHLHPQRNHHLFTSICCCYNFQTIFFNDLRFMAGSVWLGSDREWAWVWVYSFVWYATHENPSSDSCCCWCIHVEMSVASAQSCIYREEKSVLTRGKMWKKCLKSKIKV